MKYTKHTLRKKSRKTRNKSKKSQHKSRKNLGGFINSSNITNAYNTANKTYQGINDAYVVAKQKYQETMEKYQDMKQKYDQMKQELEQIYNDPEVQKHLSTLSSQLNNINQPTSNKPMEGGFFNPSALNNVYQSANTAYSNKKQTLNAVYNHPEVKQNMKDLSKHSYNVAKHGSLFGVNVATAAPISAAYRGYNTYSSAKKGISSAKNLYSTANNVYKSNIVPPQPNQNI